MAYSRYFKTATPTATGMPTPRVRKKSRKSTPATVRDSPSETPIVDRNRPRRNTAQAMPTYASHRICWRSSRVPRRNLRTKATREAATATTVATAFPTRAAEVIPPQPSTPKGLAVRTPVITSTGPSFTATPAAPRTAPTTHSHRTGRQRADGSRPVGNSSNSRGIVARLRVQLHCTIHAAYRGAGSESVPARPRTAYWVRNAISVSIDPMNSRVHPTALRLRDAIKVPTVAYPMPARAMSRLNPRSPPAVGGGLRLVHTIAAAPSAVLRNPTDQASRDAIRSFMHDLPDPIVLPGLNQRKGVNRTSREQGSPDAGGVSL